MVPLDRLRSGQRALFALAGPIIFRDMHPDIVLIDEPEQHLHVQWQRQLLDFETLSALSKGETAAQIQRSAHDHARKLLWWMRIARKMRELSRIPQVIQELRGALRAKAGL